MMYSINDVIIDRNNPDILNSLDKECYVGKNPYECLSYALEDINIHKLDKVSKTSNLPFIIKTTSKSPTKGYPCIILRK